MDEPNRTSSTSSRSISTQIVFDAMPSTFGAGGSSASSFSCSSCPAPGCYQTQNLGAFNGNPTKAPMGVYTVWGDFNLSGVGTRDAGQGQWTVSGIPDAATIVDAFLYWNTLTTNCVSAMTINFGPGGIGEGDNVVNGACVGYCADTCWAISTQPQNCDGSPYPQNIANQVFRGNVGPNGQNIISGLGSTVNGMYNVINLPFDGAQPFATGDGATCGANSPRYPGCTGSQGVSLLIIYENPGQTDPKLKRQIGVYDGAVLVTTNLIFGGTGTYQVSWDTTYSNQMALGFGVGDAQDYPDQAIFNDVQLINPNSASTPFNGNDGTTNFFGADEGNLLFSHSVLVGDGLASNNVQVVSPSGGDCLNWFLFVWSGGTCACQLKIQLTSVEGTPGYASNAGVITSLGIQHADVSVLIDSCSCLDPSNPPQLIINGGAPETIPSGGVLVEENDTIDIKITQKTSCILCEHPPPYCGASTSSSSSSM